jgi:small subunit ribosomal protein S4
MPLTAKAERVMEKKPYPPGDQGGGQGRRRKESIYKRQLVEKQRLRAIYNIHEKQMRIYYKKATHMHMHTPEALVQLLEMRLDAIIAHGGLARTIYAARQYVNHGHIEVNGKRVDITSYRVKVGDVISVREKSKKMPAFEDATSAAAHVPEYVELDKDKLQIKVTSVPQQSDVPYLRDVDLSLVIEFYSR